jgi:hypothetical protein
LIAIVDLQSNKKLNLMEQLIEQLTVQFGISEDQATGIISTVKNYLASNNPATSVAAENTEKATEAKQTVTASEPVKEESLLEKAEHFVTDHLPGGLKEKAEEMLGGVGNKIKGLFS